MKLPRDYKPSQELIKKCEAVGLEHLGNELFLAPHNNARKFDLSASGYEYKQILQNILNQL